MCMMFFYKAKISTEVPNIKIVRNLAAKFERCIMPNNEEGKKDEKTTRICQTCIMEFAANCASVKTAAN